MNEAYLIAMRLRRNAEKTTDPELYERTALAFEKLVMMCAAKRMWDRAGHYARLNLQARTISNAVVVSV